MKNRFLILMLTLIGIHAFSVGLYAEDTLRYFQFDPLRPYHGISVANRIVLQRFRTSKPVRVLGFSMRLYATSPSRASIYVLEDAGGAGFPEFIDRQILDDRHHLRVTMPQPNGTYPLNFRYPDSMGLVLKEPGQFFIGIQSEDDVLVVYDTVNNTANMCQDGDSSFASGSHELSMMVTTLEGGERRWSAVPGNGSLLIQVYVEPLEDSAVTTFSDITTSNFTELLHGDAIAWGDFDNDGDQDLLSSGVLWVNNGQGSFARNSLLHGVDGLGIWVDLDNDGWLDILTATQIFKNNGDGSFTQQSGTGQFAAPSNPTLTAADYDGDGLLDFFVGTGEKPVRVYNATKSDSADVVGVGYKSRLYRNLGGFTFQDVTDQAFIGYTETLRGYNPLTQQVEILGFPVVHSSNWIDFDHDGDLDLFWGVHRLAANYLWRNNGDGTFTNVADATGLVGETTPAYPGVYGNTVGSDFEDYDNDGDVDAALGQSGEARVFNVADRTAIYNQGAPSTFVDVNNRDTLTGIVGIAYNEAHADVCWGDYDNDGLVDIYLNASEICHNSSLYHQTSNHSFEPQTYRTGTQSHGVRGLAWVDIDNDGDLDLLVGGGQARARLFRNEWAARGRNWVEIVLRLDTGSNRFGIGSTVTVYSDTNRYIRTVSAGYGSQSQKPSVVYVGLGKGKVDSVAVEFPKNAGQAIPRLVLRSIPTNVITLIRDMTGGSVSVPIEPIVVESGLHVVPNPARAMATVKVTSTMFGAHATIEIVNYLGESVRMFEDIDLSSQAQPLDLTGMAMGMYIVRATGNGYRAITTLQLLK